MKNYCKAYVAKYRQKLKTVVQRDRLTGELRIGCKERGPRRDEDEEQSFTAR